MQTVDAVCDLDSIPPVPDAADRCLHLLPPFLGHSEQDFWHLRTSKTPLDGPAATLRRVADLLGGHVCTRSASRGKWASRICDMLALRYAIIVIRTTAADPLDVGLWHAQREGGVVHDA